MNSASTSPMLVQFWTYLHNLLSGNLGRSYAQKTDVWTLIVARLPATLTLMFAGIFVEVVLGLMLGTIAAVRRGGFVDRAVMMAPSSARPRRSSSSPCCCFMSSPSRSAGFR
jgi:ABC-type dipeptide/oligopeptide/nickel transport system permease component